MRTRLSILLSLLLPLPALAQAPKTFSQLVGMFIGFINPIVSILVTLALVLFFWGIVRYIYAADSSEAHEKGRQMIVWGIVALFVLLCVWGLSIMLMRLLINGA